MADLKIISVAENGLVTFSFSNISEYAVGKIKLFQDYIKYLYGDQGANLLSIIKGDMKRASSPEKKNFISNAISNTNIYILRRQDGKTLHSDEKFIDAKLVDYKVISKEEVSISIMITTESGQELLSL